MKKGPPRQSKSRSSGSRRHSVNWIVVIAVAALIAIGLNTRRRPAAFVPAAPSPAPAVTDNSGFTLTRAASASPQAATNSPVAEWRTRIPLLPEADRVAAYSDAGDQLLARRNFAEAAEAFRESLKLDTASESVHYNLGIALAGAGKVDEAVAAYQEALNLAPDYAEAHNNLGNLMLRKGDLDSAMKHFREAIGLNPEVASGYNNYGIALARQGRPEEALAQFTRAVELDPAYLEARFNLAQAFLAAQQPDKAAGEFREVLKLSPGFQPAQRALERIAAEKTKGD